MPPRWHTKDEQFGLRLVHTSDGKRCSWAHCRNLLLESFGDDQSWWLWNRSSCIFTWKYSFKSEKVTESDKFFEALVNLRNKYLRNRCRYLITIGDSHSKSWRAWCNEDFTFTQNINDEVFVSDSYWQVEWSRVVCVCVLVYIVLLSAMVLYDKFQDS